MEALGYMMREAIGMAPYDEKADHDRIYLLAWTEGVSFEQGVHWDVFETLDPDGVYRCYIQAIDDHRFNYDNKVDDLFYHDEARADGFVLSETEHGMGHVVAHWRIRH
jgi:hypothetical protein